MISCITQDHAVQPLPCCQVRRPGYNQLTASCVAATDAETGRARGFAHVEFETLEAAAKAIAMTGTEFGGREIFIDSAESRARPAGGGGRGDAGGRGAGETWTWAEAGVRLL